MPTEDLQPVPIQQELRGRLRNIGKLNHWLMAVAEVITNALHAIEDSHREGSVAVSFERRPSAIDGQQLILPQGSNSLDPVADVIVRDDGVGFNRINFESFCKSDSLLKVSRGGKGVGRFHCLQGFARLHVISTFAETDVWQRRELVLQPEEPELKARISSNGATGFRTEVSLLELRPAYAQSAMAPLKEDVDWLAEHFLAALVVKPTWLTSLHISDGSDSFELTSVVAGKALWTEPFKIRNYEFFATCYSVREGIRSDQVRLVAGGRVVDANTRALEYYFPHLAAISEQQPHIVLVRSSFFDESVNEARNGVSFSESPDPLLGVTAAEFSGEFANALTPKLSERLSESDEALRAHVARVVKEEAPQYQPLLVAYFQSKEFSGLSTSARPEEILTSLDGYKRREAASLRRESTRIARLSKTAADYEASAIRLVEGIAIQKKVTLAEYVALRRIILDRLKSLLEADDRGQTSLEKDIHELIVPMRTDTESAPAFDHQLWIVDERLESHHYLSSDKPLHGSKGDRPDVLIALDRPSAFANEPDEKPAGHDRIVLVEFKQAMKDLVNAPLDKLPHRQMMRYADEIIDGKARYAKSNRIVKTSSDVRFYMYAVCELSEDMLERLQRADEFIPSPAGDGAFVVKNAGKYYIEYISLLKLLDDAVARNRAFFEKLGFES
jgi:hypothetical protein